MTDIRSWVSNAEQYAQGLMGPERAPVYASCAVALALADLAMVLEKKRAPISVEVEVAEQMAEALQASEDALCMTTPAHVRAHEMRTAALAAYYNKEKGG